MDGKLTINELLELESELNTATMAPSCERDAKINMLKYLQIDTVEKYEVAYDELFYELYKKGGLERLRNITPVRSKGNLQPKVYDLQGCEDAAKLEKQVDLYLADAKLAKPHLDELIRMVVDDLEGCEAHYAEVKSRGSTVRKVHKSYEGNVRRVADMARLAVVCKTPEGLEQVYMGIMEHLQPQDVLRVTNGFNSDWMPSGYRDVKVNPIVNGHLCEVQLHLGSFFSFKDGQHAVYEWARELNVPSAMRAQHLFENVSDEVTKEMTSLAEQNWRGTESHLPYLHLAAGNYVQAQEGLHKELHEAKESVLRLDENSEEWRQAVLTEARARCNVGRVLALQGDYAGAQPFYQLPLAMVEKTLGPEHPAVATMLDNLANLLHSQGNYDEAEPLFQRSLAIHEKVLGPDHPDVATSLNNLAVLLESRGDYGGAEPLYRRSLAIDEKALGEEHPKVAPVVDNLARLLASQSNYDEAEQLYQRSLAIRKTGLGPDHPDVAVSLNNLAVLLLHQGNYAKAKPLSQRSLAIKEKTLGPEHPELASSLNNLAGIFYRQGNCDEALPLYQRSLAIKEKALGPEHPSLAISLINLAGIFYSQGNYDEAKPLFQRSLTINEKVLGPDHPVLATSLNNLAVLLSSQGNYAEAEPLFQRSLAIREKALGPEHPDVATSLNNLAEMLDSQGKYSEAEPLYQRSLATFEKALGPEHPSVVTSLKNLAMFLVRQDKPNEALPLLEKVLAIQAHTLGEGHEDTIITQKEVDIAKNKVGQT